MPRHGKVQPQNPEPEYQADDDARRTGAGYVTFPTGPRCGNCKYSADRGAHISQCLVWDFQVDNANGCCDDWEAHDGQGRDWRKDFEAGEKERTPGERPIAGREPAPAD